jgi:hypothetical protein
VSLAVVVIFSCKGIREDELACEDAVSHLQECCPAFTGSNIDCQYNAGGCDTPTVYPELNVGTSACIRNETCDVLRSSGVCGRALLLPSAARWADPPSGTSGSGSVETAPEVCP